VDIWILVALIAIFAGLVKGISGFGSSLVAIPLLTLLFGTEFVKDSVVVMITFNLVLNSLLLIENKGFHPDSLKRVWIIPLFGAIFTVVGIIIFVNVPDAVITYTAGGLILLAIANKGFRLKMRLPETPWVKAIIGTLSGMGNGIASIDGPPVVFYLTSIQAEKTYFKNVLASHFLVTGFIAVVLHVIWGSYNVDLILIIAVMLVFTVVGLLIGNKISRNMNQAVFDKIVLVILFALAISMFYEEIKTIFLMIT